MKKQEQGQHNFFGNEALNGLIVGVLMLITTVLICCVFFNFQIFP